MSSATYGRACTYTHKRAFRFSTEYRSTPHVTETQQKHQGITISFIIYERTEFEKLLQLVADKTNTEIILKI